MSNIVSIINGEALTTSIAIAEGVDRPHKNIIELIRENLSDFEHFGPIAFETRKGKALAQGGFAKATEYALLNEHQATLLITFMRNIGVVKEFKKILVKAFFEMRDELAKVKTSSAIDLDNPEFVANLIAQSAQKVQALKEAKQQLEHKIEKDAPKVEFHDKVASCPDSISVGEAAKILGTGRRRLFAFLRQHHWVTRKNEPYQSKIESGHMDVKLSPWEHPTQGLQRSVTPLITGKGLTELQKIYEGAAA